jgi:hypothetical protein
LLLINRQGATSFIVLQLEYLSVAIVLVGDRQFRLTGAPMHCTDQPAQRLLPARHQKEDGDPAHDCAPLPVCRIAFQSSDISMVVN